MSNAVFPTLAGLTWNVVRQPEFHTKTQKAVSGREIRLAFMAYPMYTFKMTYEVLRQTGANEELENLCGFFLQRQGSFDSFLYSDPTDNSVTAQGFGTGDGATKSFQLVRPFGTVATAFYEPVQNLNGTPTIYSNGTVVSGANYTISNGLVTFTTAPANGAVLTWTGSFYYRVRFNMDSAEFNQFMKDLWELKKCELYGSPMNKV